jgi:hypothetical protein
MLMLRMPRLVMPAAGPLAYLCIWLVCWLVRWTKERACVEVVETAREPSAKPKPLTPRAALQSNVKRKGAAAEFRADFILWLQQHEICEQMPSKQPAALAMRPPGHKLLLIVPFMSVCGDGAGGCLERSARA